MAHRHHRDLINGDKLLGDEALLSSLVGDKALLPLLVGDEFLAPYWWVMRHFLTNYYEMVPTPLTADNDPLYFHEELAM